MRRLREILGDESDLVALNLASLLFLVFVLIAIWGGVR